MPQTMTDDIADFLTELARQEVAEKTIRAYCSDLAHVARWFEGATGEPFSAAALTPTDVRDDKAHLASTVGPLSTHIQQVPGGNSPLTPYPVWHVQAVVCSIAVVRATTTG